MARGKGQGEGNKPVIVEHYNLGTPEVKKEVWWGSKNPHEQVFPLVEDIRSRQGYRTAQNLKFCRLYSNQDMVGLGFSNYAKTAPSISARNPNRLTLNIVQSCVDTGAAKIAKNKPRIQFLTRDGNYIQKRKAKKLTTFLGGLFSQTGVYGKTSRVFIDAEVLGTGCVKIYVDPNDHTIKVDRVFPEEITVDDIEGMYGEPRQMHQSKSYSRDVLKAMFPKFSSEIDSSGTPSEGSTAIGMDDQITVIESWHLPSKKGGKDGRHTICISGATLWSGKYDKDYFPFAFFRWIDKLLGFWGMGLAEQLVGIQLEINKVLSNIQSAQNLMCIPRIFVEESSKVGKNMFTNEIGAVIPYRGTQPTMVTGNGMATETYSYLESLIKKAYEFSGISQLSAAQKKPAGLDSGVALREYQDIESERFMLTGMRYETLHMEIGRQMIDLARDLYSDDVDVEVKAVGSKFIKSIKWSDVDLEEDEYEMQMFPVSLLPTTPAGKLAYVQELAQAGLIDQGQTMDLLNFPDTEGFFARVTADRDNIERILEKILDDGDYTVPEKLMNLPLASELTKQAILMAMNDSVEPERIDLLRTFLEAVDTLQVSDIPAPTPAGPPPADPVGVPAPPPVSDLLPQSGSPQGAN